MGFLHRLTTWYFSKSALPYWCVLILDCIIIVSSGMMGTYVGQGSRVFRGDGFWNILFLWMCSLVFYIIGMRAFHTYSGVLRYSSFVDLARVAGALAVGFVLSMMAKIVLSDGYRLPIGAESVLVANVIAVVFMWAERIFVKNLFVSLQVLDKTAPIFIYGVREGGVGLAKSILTESQSQYRIKGFISDESEMVDKYLLGIKVYPANTETVKLMESNHVKSVLVSPLYSQSFRNRQDLVDAISDADIRILMMPTAQKWDGKTQLSYLQLQEVEIEDLLPRDEISIDIDRKSVV